MQPHTAFHIVPMACGKVCGWLRTVWLPFHSCCYCQKSFLVILGRWPCSPSTNVVNDTSTCLDVEEDVTNFMCCFFCVSDEFWRAQSWPKLHKKLCFFLFLSLEETKKQVRTQAKAQSDNELTGVDCGTLTNVFSPEILAFWHQTDAVMQVVMRHIAKQQLNVIHRCETKTHQHPPHDIQRVQLGWCVCSCDSGCLSWALFFWKCWDKETKLLKLSNLQFFKIWNPCKSKQKTELLIKFPKCLFFIRAMSVWRCVLKFSAIIWNWHTVDECCGGQTHLRIVWFSGVCAFSLVVHTAWFELYSFFQGYD